MATPIQHFPRGSAWDGEHFDKRKVRKIVATVDWADGTATTHDPAYTQRWTNTHVQVVIFGLVERAVWHELWLPAAQVTAHPEPIHAGEHLPSQEWWPTGIQIADPELCPSGHTLDEVGFSRSWVRCDCAASRGHDVWVCRECGDSIYAPAHDPQHRQHKPY